jgi:hypothetical protein
VHCVLVLAANAALGALAGFGIADAAGYPVLFYIAIGVAGGCLAGAAACLAADVAGLPKVVDLVGTLAVCAAALLGHLSPPGLKTAAVVFWLVGLVTQATGLAMALNERRAEIASKRLDKPARQKIRGA